MKLYINRKFKAHQDAESFLSETQWLVQADSEGIRRCPKEIYALRKSAWEVVLKRFSLCLINTPEGQQLVVSSRTSDDHDYEVVWDTKIDGGIPIDVEIGAMVRKEKEFPLFDENGKKVYNTTQSGENKKSTKKIQANVVEVSIKNKKTGEEGKSTVPPKRIPLEEEK